MRTTSFVQCSSTSFTFAALSCIFLVGVPEAAAQVAPISNTVPSSTPRTESAAANQIESISFYVYPDNANTFNRSNVDTRAHFEEIRTTVGGGGGNYGRVGIALNYPYTGFVDGNNPGNFAPAQGWVDEIRRIVSVAAEIEMPVLIGFNGAVWAEAIGPFNDYWKTAEGGRYLNRYMDEKVNVALPARDTYTRKELEPYLNIGSYQWTNSLHLTLSQYATDYQDSRLKLLGQTANLIKEIAQAYSGTIKALTTDSEVCAFSFRTSGGSTVSVGYEEFQTENFCKENDIADCDAFFNKGAFTYESDLEKKWADFRANTHKLFIQSSVNELRKVFPGLPIYTHEIPEKDGGYFKYGGQDFASYQVNAFAKKALPGYTLYVFNKDDAEFKEIIVEISAKVRRQGLGHWGAMEFNPSRGNFPGGKDQVEDYTWEILSFLYEHDVRVVAPLAWISNKVDSGIRDTGVADGIRRFIMQGPKNR